jgi:hypothetical protein
MVDLSIRSNSNALNKYMKQTWPKIGKQKLPLPKIAKFKPYKSVWEVN